MKLAATIPPWVEAGRGRTADWWRARSRREQVLLAMLAGLAALVMLVEFLLLPFATVRSDARRDIAAYDRLQARVRALGPAPAGLASGDVATTARAAAASYGVTITSATPDGATARLALIGAGYEPLVRWLAALQRNHGIRVETMTLRAAAQPGLVDATLVLAR